MEKIDILSLSQEELEEKILDIGEKKFRAKQIYDWLHNAKVEDFSKMTNLSAQLREKLNNIFWINSLKIQKRLVSNIDNTVKYLYGLSDGEKVETVLMEFPVHSISINIPDWVCELGAEHYLVKRITEPLNAIDSVAKMRDYGSICSMLSDIEDYEAPRLEQVSLGSGEISIELRPVSSMFYKILGEECGYEIKDDAHLVASIKSFVAAKKEYDRIEGALRCAKSTGYGMVPPELDEMMLEEPEIVRQGNRFGVRLRAKASGLHIIKVDIASEVAPLVGTEEQSEAFMAYLMETFEKDPQKLWQTDIFGKSLRDMIRESMAVKVNALPENVQQRLHDTVEKMVNNGCSGLICIML